jgi:hypothetical protein
LNHESHPEAVVGGEKTCLMLQHCEAYICSISRTSFIDMPPPFIALSRRALRSAQLPLNSVSDAAFFLLASAAGPTASGHATHKIKKLNDTPTCGVVDSRLEFPGFVSSRGGERGLLGCCCCCSCFLLCRSGGGGGAGSHEQVKRDEWSGVGSSRC